MDEWIIFSSQYVGLDIERWNSRLLPVFIPVGDNTLISVRFEVFKKYFMSFYNDAETGGYEMLYM